MKLVCLFVSFLHICIFRCFAFSLTYFILANIYSCLYGIWVQNGFNVAAWCWGLPFLGKWESLNFTLLYNAFLTIPNLFCCETAQYSTSLCSSINQECCLGLQWCINNIHHIICLNPKDSWKLLSRLFHCPVHGLGSCFSQSSGTELFISHYSP